VYCGRISVPKKEADLMPNRLATRHETELEGRMFRLLAGAVGDGVEESCGLSSILHGRRHHRVGVLGVIWLWECGISSFSCLAV
jgi:hypothetical protein